MKDNPFFRQTADDLVREALRGARDYCSRIRYGTKEFDVETCVASMRIRLTEHCNRLGGRRHYHNIPQDEAGAFDLVLDHLTPALREKAIEMRSTFYKQRKVSSINYTAALALIEETLKAAGLSGSVERQPYRVKVSAGITPTTTIHFYVNYKDLATPGMIERLVGSLTDIRDALGRLGKGVTIKRNH